MDSFISWGSGAPENCTFAAASSSSSLCGYHILLKGLFLIPRWHFFLGFIVACTVVIYNFLESHFFEDLFSGFRGCPANITCNPDSEIYSGIASKCRIIHGRYLATPWLSSPHIQTTFLNFFGRPPSFSYRRQIFNASDGGTIALDWLLSSYVSGGASCIESSLPADDTTPIVIVVPGLTSDSASPYLKHLSFNTAKCGWNVVVSNHRGLGGVSVTSDCFYNAGWTEDLRVVINYLHKEYPKAPLFAIGTSIGANILVKYLGEDGDSVPIAGAVAICSPWDLLIGDRFINRRLVQKLYDRALTIGLQGYAQMHQPRYSRLANWDGIKKSRSIRDFDIYATCLVGKFETVDTYYRRCSSSSYVGNVAIPLLCISALDDPLCTREAIPWDECRANKNIVLVTTKHGGHLAFFEGLSGSSLWWVRASNEFLHVLHSSPYYMHVQKKVKDNSGLHSTLDSSIDQGPYVNVADGMVAAAGNEHTREIIEEDEDCKHPKDLPIDPIEMVPGSGKNRLQAANKKVVEDVQKIPVARSVLQILGRTRKSVWLLAYIAVITSWPLVGSAIGIFFKRKIRKAPTRSA